MIYPEHEDDEKERKWLDNFDGQKLSKWEFETANKKTNTERNGQ